jgi:hypothetical protein
VHVVRTCPTIVCTTAFAAALAVVSFLGFVPVATGTSGCATNVVADWYEDGRIDNRYALYCYDEAIGAIPSDVRDYTDAQEVIARALEGAARDPGLSRHAPRTPRTPSVVVNPPPRDVPMVETSSPSSIPLPFVVLGSLSLALSCAGAFGYLKRRCRARTMSAG